MTDAATKSDEVVTETPLKAPAPDKKVSESEIVKVHVERMMSNDLNWRIMGMVGIEGVWATVHKNERDMMIAAGVDAAYFEKSEHVFSKEEQPLVELKRDGKYAEFQRILFRTTNTYLSYIEWRKTLSITPEPVKTETKPVAKATELTIEAIDSMIGKLMDTRRDQRKQIREDQKIIVTPDDLKREEAEIRLEVTSHIDTMIENYGKIQLRNLWQSRQTGEFRALPGDPQTVAESLMNQLLKQRDYTLSMAHVVDKIFPDVEAASKTKEPFLHPVSGVVIDVPYLITTPGLIAKLTKSADYWSKLVDIDAKRKYMEALVTKSFSELASVREAGAKVTESGNRIKLFFDPIPGSKNKMMRAEVTPDLEKVILKALKPLIEDTPESTVKSKKATKSPNAKPANAAKTDEPAPENPSESSNE